MLVGMKNSNSETPVSAFPALDVSAFGAYDCLLYTSDAADE